VGKGKWDLETYGFGAGLFVAASALPPRSEKVRRRERKVMPLMAARV
jgi:hypothetical protein